MTTPAAPYTVLSRVDGHADGPVLASGVRTLAAAIREQRAAKADHIGNVRIIGADGRTVDESAEEYQIAEESL